MGSPCSWGGAFVHEKESGDRKARYEALRDELGDNSFNRKLKINANLPLALINTIDNIRIIVNQDYTDNYPAGADVSALFTPFYEHPYAVIQNNYRSPEDAYQYESTCGIPQAIYKCDLSDVDLSAKKALGTTFFFLLNTAPARSGNYTFTIKAQPAGAELLSTTAPISITVE